MYTVYTQLTGIVENAEAFQVGCGPVRTFQVGTHDKGIRQRVKKVYVIV
jgi:hypothetical protein